MSSLKKLASQTAIYGLSSIVGRLLNFLLTPLHTTVLAKEEYGQNTDIYAMIPFLMVLLTFGMETAFFRHFKKDGLDNKKVFSSSIGLVVTLSIVLLLITYLFLPSIAHFLKYDAHPEFILWMMIIVAVDAITAVPYAKLRAENKPIKFLIVRLGTTFTIIVFNLLFFLLLPWMQENNIGSGLLEWAYHPELGVGYILIANLIGNGFLLAMFMPELIKINLRPNFSILKKLVLYSSPLVLAGFAGIANEMANRQFLKYLLPENIAFEQLATFGANAKIATFMMLFIQAFRFAAEPFFFQGEGEFKEKMARVMRYFVILQAIIFVGLICFIDVIKHFIDPKYWDGLSIVPILLFANLLLGINFNLNIWYKLENKTKLGAYITFVGLLFTVVFNLILIPKYQYQGAAWATLISYASMTLYSYYLNQKHSPTDYPLARILLHLVLALVTVGLSFYLFDSHLMISTFIFALYAIFIWFSEGKLILQTLKNGQ